MKKLKKKSLCAACLAAVLCAGLALTAFCASDVKTATLTKGNPSAYGGVIDCREVAFWGENYDDSNQDMRLVIKKKIAGVWYCDFDETMIPNSAIGSEKHPKYSSHYDKDKSFEVSVHAKWAGTDAHGYGTMKKYL